MNVKREAFEKEIYNHDEPMTHKDVMSCFDRVLAVQPDALNLAAMREVGRVTRGRAARAIEEKLLKLPPLTDAELMEIWERSQRGATQ
jgi:hypothetical protein